MVGLIRAPRTGYSNTFEYIIQNYENILELNGYETSFGSSCYVIDSGTTLFKNAGQWQLPAAAVQMPLPSIFPNAGSVIKDTVLYLSSATDGATIYYTVNGDTPTSGSTEYNAGTGITLTADVTVKAIAIKGGDSSLVMTATYDVVSLGTVATPAADPEAGEVESGALVTLSCATPGATIYYTTNGSTPTSGSAEYTEAIEITEAVTIKAIACLNGYTDSGVMSAAYTIAE